MREQMLKGEETQVYKIWLFSIPNRNYNVLFLFQLRKTIQEKAKDGSLKSTNGSSVMASAKVEQRKRGRWDQTIDEQFVPAKKSMQASTVNWDDVNIS